MLKRNQQLEREALKAISCDCEVLFFIFLVQDQRHH